jgi:predicted secreted hydrolase
LIRLFVALLLAYSLFAQYQVALPGYRYEFPRDHFDHPDYQTEWWYYTGNLKTPDGHRFGFELTFFRQGVNRDPKLTSAWQIEDLYLAHLALSDLDGKRFYHFERMNRAGPGLAGVDAGAGRIWNGNWSIAWARGLQNLEAAASEFTLHLKMESNKPPVIHGKNGVSQKAAGAGRASHYLSFTRLLASGSLELNGKPYSLTGTAWMDHEFFTHQLEGGQGGWDWFSLQLDDGTELMLYRIRRADGAADPFSAGTYVDARGIAKHLDASDFSLEPGETWTSPDTGGKYPIRWRIAAPSLGIDLEAATPLANQEMTGASRFTPNYWEGAIEVTGKRGAATIRGVGYLEMTGYDRPVDLGR